MKKTYITPSVEVIEVGAISMMATSLNVYNDNESSVDTSEEGVQLGREDRPGNPNVWEQGW